MLKNGRKKSANLDLLVIVSTTQSCKTKFGKNFREKNYTFYSVFREFGQAKFPNSCLVLGLSKFSLLPQLPQKNDTQFKSFQI